MKTFFKLSLLILSLLSIFPSCKEEENESKPVLNNFYISSAIDATGDYRISTLDTGKSYYGNGATSGTMADQSLSVGNKLNPNQFVKQGYRFTGWNRAIDGSDVEYEDKESFSIKHKGNDMNYPRHVTLYAQWTENLPTIRISLEDNSARTILPSINYNDYSFRLDGFNDKNATVSKTWQNKDTMTSDVLELSEGTWQFTLTAGGI